MAWTIATTATAAQIPPRRETDDDPAVGLPVAGTMLGVGEAVAGTTTGVGDAVAPAGGLVTGAVETGEPVARVGGSVVGGEETGESVTEVGGMVVGGAVLGGTVTAVGAMVGESEGPSYSAGDSVTAGEGAAVTNPGARVVGVVGLAVGALVGLAVGGVGARVGALVGLLVGGVGAPVVGAMVGALVGLAVGGVGARVGALVGLLVGGVGAKVVGARVGALVGFRVGARLVGGTVGALVGLRVGARVGSLVGLTVTTGGRVGDLVAFTVGEAVVAAVKHALGRLLQTPHKPPVGPSSSKLADVAHHCFPATLAGRNWVGETSSNGMHLLQIWPSSSCQGTHGAVAEGLRWVTMQRASNGGVAWATAAKATRAATLLVNILLRF